MLILGNIESKYNCMEAQTQWFRWLGQEIQAQSQVWIGWEYDSNQVQIQTQSIYLYIYTTFKLKFKPIND